MVRYGIIKRFYVNGDPGGAKRPSTNCKKLTASLTYEDNDSTYGLKILSTSLLADSVRLLFPDIMGLPLRGPVLWTLGKQ